VSAEPRLKQVAQDIITHFEQRNASMEGKGLIVAMSRDICVGLYDAIIALKPEWHDPDPTKGAIKIVMTGSAQDKDLLKPHIYSSATKKQLEKRFKDPSDPLKLVIVRDMWLTGLDVPCLHTMYIDKPMKGHSLMQAIARVNRVFGTKTNGLVVDYLGIAADLREALKTYSENRGKGSPAVDNHEAFAKLLEQMDVARNILHGFDYSQYLTKGLLLLVPAASFLLNPDQVKDGKERWFTAVVNITKLFSLCGTLDEALLLREEIAFFQAVRIVILKAGTPDKQLSDESKSALLKQILDNAVIADGVQDIFKLANIERPNLGILSDAFLDDIRNNPNRNFAVELLQRLLNDSVKAQMRNNVVQEKKYGDRLQATLLQYNNRNITSADVIAKLIELAKEFREAASRGEKLGLNPAELAFFDALASNESAAREMQDDVLKIIAQELAAKLRKSTTVDWQKRESVRARLRNLVRITLRNHKYPPEYTDAAVQLVLTQAERLADEWSQSA
jgi:type I restriction enzyme R subunit